MSEKGMEQIGNVILNYKYYSGQDNYSDGDIENDILHAVEQSGDVMEILQQEDRWPFLYHLSPVRQNILDWYDMKENATVLEIGAGCGAITGALCRKAGRVVCNDLSRRRSLINANRNREYQNLEIMVGNFNDVVFEEKFDYITLIGVLEYARYYTDAPDPFVGFLEKIRGLLKADGKLLIAIENKYGLKYFAGAREDHSGHFFDGIEGYRQTKSQARTFSRERLEEMIQKSGYQGTRFFYPFPDYKFPTQIFSDDHLPKSEDLILGRSSYDNTRMYLFNEAAAYEEILKDGKFPFFSNSFFVEASLQDVDNNATSANDRGQKVYSKFTKERREDYQIETMMYHKGEQTSIGKRCIYAKGTRHMAKMIENYEYFQKKMPGVLAGIKTWGDDRAVQFEFIHGVSLAESLDHCVEQGLREQFLALLQQYCDLARQLVGEQTENRADHVNTDLNFDNVIVTADGTLRVIDYEWISEELMPVDFPIYRALYAYYIRSHNSLGQFISIEECREFCKISSEDWNTYQQMNENYNDRIMGDTYNYEKILTSYEKDVLDLGDILLDTTDFAQIYVDRGAGYSEADSMRHDISCTGHLNCIQVELNGDEQNIRIDPMNPGGLIELIGIRMQDTQGNDLGELEFATNASMTEGNRYLYMSEDPQYLISLQKQRTKIGAGYSIVVQYRIISRFTDSNVMEGMGVQQSAVEQQSLVTRGKNRVKRIFSK